MSRDNRDRVILRKIVKYCDEVSETVARFGSAYAILAGDKIYQNAAAMCILQIGELAGHLSDDFIAVYPEMPWRSMKGMRNIAAHTYESFDVITLWNTICKDIPSLRSYCAQILEQKMN